MKIPTTDRSCHPPTTVLRPAGTRGAAAAVCAVVALMPRRPAPHQLRSCPGHERVAPLSAAPAWPRMHRSACRAPGAAVPWARRHLRLDPIVGAVPREVDRPTEVAMAFLARLTRAARTGRVDSYPSPIVQATLNDASDFVPQHERVLKLGISDAAFDEPVEVLATQSNGGYPNQALARAGLG